MKSVKFGNLGAIQLDPEGEIERTIVLLHGYGAPGTDLVGLAPGLGLTNTRFIFLQAPITLDELGAPGGRAWWHIDMMALQVMRMMGRDDELAHSEPQGLREARDFLSAALSEIEGLPGFSWSTTFLGGFSQGAMLTCDWTLRNKPKAAGLIQLSGTVLCQDDWEKELTHLSGLRVFQSHSPEDQVLPFSLAERLTGLLREAGLPVSFVSFRGGHGIGPDVLEKLAEFVSGG